MCASFPSHTPQSLLSEFGSGDHEEETVTQQNELRAGEDERKQERLNKTVTIFPFIYVNIRSKSSGI